MNKSLERQKLRQRYALKSDTTPVLSCLYQIFLFLLFRKLPSRKSLKIHFAISECHCWSALTLRSSSASEIPNFLDCCARVDSACLSVLCSFNWVRRASFLGVFFRDELFLDRAVRFTGFGFAFFLFDSFEDGQPLRVCSAARFAISICSSVAGPG